jgi:Tfp pilus assembly protein PilF
MTAMPGWQDQTAADAQDEGETSRMKQNMWVVLAVAVAWTALAAVQVKAETPTMVATGRAHTTLFSPDEIRDRLVAITPLQLPVHESGDGAIKSHVLCFCLHKGPEMVRDLRRQAAVRFQQGLVALQKHDGDVAIAAFTKAIQFNPRDALAYVNRGLAYSRAGDFRQARSDFSRALEVDARQGVAYYARGLVALLLGLQAEAKRDLQQAANLGDERAHVVLETMPTT